jgi:hypothetical protein
MATQSSIRKPKDTLEKPIPDSSIPYIDFKTLAKQNARNSLQSYKKKLVAIVITMTYLWLIFSDDVQQIHQLTIKLENEVTWGS